MKELIRKNTKIITAFIIGILVSGVSVYKAAGKLYASSIDVDTSKMSELGETSNVNLALDYLYGKASNIKSNVNNNTGPTIWPGDATNIGILYLDPTNLTRSCTIDNSFYNIGITYLKTGCMKWYIYKEDSSKYYAILDHNISSALSNWSYAADRLDIDTAAWEKTTTNEANKLVVRLITAQEVADIIGNSEWNVLLSGDQFLDGTQATGKGTSRYAWLYDYTENCTNYGCNTADNSTYGYWTSTERDDVYSWGINYSNTLIFTSKTTGYGVRPVIEIPKTLFN